MYSDQPDYCYNDVGYKIDESAHLKKGNNSVGVSRQYAGVAGKVDNCQVGVYASLAWKSHSSLINCRLYLPESWTNDTDRCEKAGPSEARFFKTKLALALDMIKADMAAGVEFGWVGGDVTIQPPGNETSLLRQSCSYHRGRQRRSGQTLAPLSNCFGDVDPRGGRTFTAGLNDTGQSRKGTSTLSGAGRSGSAVV
ncbi:hypothetical protein CCP4SC76_4470009 [Gammaproteobacteria bacterium]